MRTFKETMRDFGWNLLGSFCLVVAAVTALAAVLGSGYGIIYGMTNYVYPVFGVYGVVVGILLLLVVIIAVIITVDDADDSY